MPVLMMRLRYLLGEQFVSIRWIVEPFQGSDVPDCNFTRLTSAELIAPLAVTSDRKLDVLTGMPDSPFTTLMSPAFTAPLPLISPTRTSIGTEKFKAFGPSVIPSKVSKRCWALVTPVRFTITDAVPLPLMLLTLPLPIGDAIVVRAWPKVRTVW